MAVNNANDRPLPLPGHFLIVGLEGSSHEGVAQAIDLIDEVQPFGVILFGRNLPNLEATLALTTALHERFPALVFSIDHEGGRVHRLPEPFTRFPPALAMTRHGDPGLVREAARCQARELRAAGFDINYAPVLDIDTNLQNPIIGNRAFGTTPEEVVHNSLPYLQGLTEAGVLGCGKHFPGHGDTSVDSHLSLPVVDHDGDRLRGLEMVPFARAIEEGIPLIMTAHVVYPALDPDRPASLSQPIIDGVLRHELGFGGIVVSDDLEMKAVTEDRAIDEAAVEAIIAGSDLVLVCRHANHVRTVHRAIAEAIDRGRLPTDLLEASDQRRKRIRRRIDRLRRVAFDTTVIGAAEHRDLAARLT